MPENGRKNIIVINLYIWGLLTVKNQVVVVVVVVVVFNEAYVTSSKSYCGIKNLIISRICIGIGIAKKIQGKTNYSPASDHQQRPVTNPTQPITGINRRFEIPSITGTGP